MEVLFLFQTCTQKTIAKSGIVRYKCRILCCDKCVI